MIRYRKNRLSLKAGVTLIELLVVIALIGIVAGFTISMFPGIDQPTNSSVARDACISMWDKCELVVNNYNKGLYDGIIPSVYKSDPKTACYFLLGAYTKADGTRVYCQVADYYQIDNAYNKTLKKTRDDNGKYFIDLGADADNNIHTTKILNIYYNYNGAVYKCAFDSANNKYDVTKQ